MLFRVRVKPSQRVDNLWRLDDGGLLAHILAVPKDGEANAYLVKFLAVRLGVAKSLVSVTKGFTSGHKTVSVDAPVEVLRAVLAEIPLSPQATLL